ncbi:hypothetical protein HYH03_003398 [Edaphochlamys debaryana]|uniref:S-adenosyl-L-methionine-dependent methyltransferase n=1 Tax=Edaphochlamys debaryana TaxID=47281 RepID=A0A835YBT6_9CHLO|nr:hypothetical protein HYH03_003398 [Edaphochlamys debaryana]|eukprot:KAG2498652.1 hypothetical protein HYH03_003398 [Edaphochlamys debaryana]
MATATATVTRGPAPGLKAAASGPGSGPDRARPTGAHELHAEVRIQEGGSTKPPALARLRRSVLSVQNLWLWPFTHYKATNKVMLCYRTLFQDLGYKGSNEDRLAATFRDYLMPLRGWVHRNTPLLLHVNKRFIQSLPFGCPGIMRYLDARTRWLDQEVATALTEGFTQVVVVAAGFDSRAYRFAAPGVTFFEVDLPEASEAKRRMVDATLPPGQFPRPAYIAADLSVLPLAQALTAGGAGGSGGAGGGGGGGGGARFDPAARTLFTVEGLLYYLPPDAVSQLLVSIRSVAAPGSRVAFDFLRADVFSGAAWEPGYETLRLTVANKGEPKRSGLDPAELGPYLGERGWRLAAAPSPQEVAAALYPHRRWRSLSPVLPPFFRFAAAEVQ